MLCLQADPLLSLTLSVCSSLICCDFELYWSQSCSIHLLATGIHRSQSPSSYSSLTTQGHLYLTLKRKQNVSVKETVSLFKCLYDQILYSHFYIFVHNRSFLDILPNFNLYNEHYNARFLDLYLRDLAPPLIFLVPILG